MTDKPILRSLSGRLFLLLLLAALMRPAVGETIQLERSEHGTYTISVQINGAMVLPFVLDTGASLVVIPEDVFRTLTRTGTVTKKRFHWNWNGNVGGRFRTCQRELCPPRGAGRRSHRAKRCRERCAG